MIVTTRILALFCAGVATQTAALAQQRVMLYGTVLAQSASGAPTPLRYAKVFLYATDGWVGPVLTDDAGHFAFYDTNRGNYTLRVYVEGHLEPVLTQSVTVPGRLPPVVVNR